MKRIAIAIAAALTALAALVWFRPLAVFEAVGAVQRRLAGFHSELVQVGPHRIRVFVGGEGRTAAPPLVLVHGLASKAADWTPLLPELSRGRRTYIIDLLGYGESDKPDVDYSVALETDIVRGAMDALHIAQADFVGNSMGGWIALRLAAEHPERVRRLVLVSSAGLPFRTTLTETSFTPATVDGQRAMIALQTDTRLPAFVLRDFIRRRKDTRFVVERGLRSMLTLRDTMEGKLARVTMPVLIVAGTADRIVPFSVSEGLQRAIPHAKLVRLDGCGHLGLYECRDRAIPPIAAFLR